MQASNSNRLLTQVFISLSQESFNEARANLELASMLVKNGENYLQLALKAQAINLPERRTAACRLPEGRFEFK